MCSAIQRKNSDSQFHAGALLNSAGLTDDAHRREGRRQQGQGVVTFVEFEHLVYWGVNHDTLYEHCHDILFHKMNRWIAVLLFICLLPPPMAGKDPGRPVPWSDLSPILVGRAAALTLPGDIRVKGKVIAVRPDGLQLEITKSSDRVAYPLGPKLIPRPAVSTIMVSKHGGYKWTVLGTAIGGGIGAVLGTAAAKYAVNEGADFGGIIAALVIVPTAVGFLAGYFSDRGTMTISVQP